MLKRNWAGEIRNLSPLAAIGVDVDGFRRVLRVVEGHKEHGIRISMDGKGSWRDNVFIERLWRSVKYEEVCLHAYDTVSDSRNGIGRYFDLYNQRRLKGDHTI